MSDNNSYTGLEIAVVGMACRFPGAKNIHEFWDNLKNGVESISFFSNQELEDAGVAPDLVNRSGFVNANGMVEDAECFDAAFFGYTPAEARVMDPQVRMFHECAWEALENGGYNPETYKGKIGIYAGASASFNWPALCFLSGVTGRLDELSANLLMDKDYLTRHISYKFNLRGPSYSLQTACSTSLVAIHVASQGLLSGECAMALAGGVTVNLPQANGYLYQEGMVMSPDGHCRAFDAGANGFVGGNGAGVVVLKLLEDALEDGDYIHAVIKGSAVNNDGSRKSGFTAPSVKSQAGVVKSALRIAETDPESIGYIETHGTGTPLGDPIEIEALTRAFKTGKKQFCNIGSVKTNVGHLDSAAGVAGFIKAALALKHRQIPPSLNFKTPNPTIDFENSPFMVCTRLTPWENAKSPLRAGVTALGIGGTNAHVVLEEFPRIEPPSTAGTPGEKSEQEPHLIILSAKTESALDKMTENLADYLENHPAPNIADVAYTLQVGRKPLTHRRVAIGFSTNDITAALSNRPAIPYHLCVGDRPKVVFMFSGLGGQYVDMGLELYRKEPFFREEMDQCFNITNTLVDYDIKKILYPSEDKHHAPALQEENAINRIDIAQLVVFIFEYALARLLMKWGIKPHSMIGYSFGEYTAACLSGVFSLENALKIIVRRGQLLREIPGGSLLSIPLPAAEVSPLLPDELSVAIDNGSACIVSGPSTVIKAFEASMKQKRLLCMPVPHSTAMHSQMVTPILAEFERELKNIQFNSPQIPYISNLTGKWTDAAEVVKPTYWCNHLRETVRFADGLKELTQKNNTIFLEIGPGRDLSAMVKRFFHDNAGQKTLNLIRPPQKDVSDVYYLSNKIGRLWLYGVNIDWPALYHEKRRRRIPLPTYPFEQQDFSTEPRIFRLFRDMETGKSISMESESTNGNTDADLTQTPLESPVKKTGSPLLQRPDLSSTYMTPTNQVEKTMVDIWEQFFGIEPIGITDDFIELGGDSLKAVTVSARTHKALNVQIPVAEFFNQLTIEALAVYIRDNAEENLFSAIAPVEEKDYHALSSAQMRLFIVNQHDVDNTAFNITAALVVRGDLKVEKFANTMSNLLERHESLRTSFRMEKNEPVQSIHETDAVAFEIEFSDLVGEEANTSEPNHYLQVISKFVRPFELSKAPLLRVGLIKAENQYLMLVDMHHIISDYISITVIIKDFIALYRGDQLPPLTIHYKDYAAWEREFSASGEMKKQENYWLKVFSGNIPVLNFPTDYPRPPAQSFEGDGVSFSIDKELYQKTGQLLEETETTLYMLLLAVCNILMWKYTEQTDIVIGSPVGGRRHADLENIIGMFVGQLPMRNYPSGDKNFREFLAEVKQNALNAYENQDYPFDVLTGQLGLQGNTGRHPLFDVVFAIFNKTGEDELDWLARIDDLEFEVFPYEEKTSKTDLRFAATETPDGIWMSITYCTALFKRSSCEKMAERFMEILTQVLENNRIKLDDINIAHKFSSAQSRVHRDAGSDFDF